MVKVKAGHRITTFGETADTIYVIINGRVAISHPNELYLKIMNDIGIKGFKDRA